MEKKKRGSKARWIVLAVIAFLLLVFALVGFITDFLWFKELGYVRGNWKKQMKGTGKKLYRSMLRAVDIPALAADFLQGCMKGQTKINLDLHASDDLAWLMRRLIRNIVLGLWVMALLISSSIICTTDMTPKMFGIPALGVLGYFGALVILMYLFIKHFMKK